MRRGVFQEYEQGDGARVFRLRWVDEIELTQEEMARGKFIQFLIGEGRLSESLTSLEMPCRSERGEAE